jgi:hypothetical protein
MRWLPTLGVVVCSGCGPSLVSPTEYCEELATIRCDAEPVCCTYPELLSTDQAACTTEILARCHSLFLGRAFDDGRASFDPIKARLALDAMADDAATCTLSDSAPDFVTGHAGIGGDCGITELDSSGFFACREGLTCNEPEGVCAEPIWNLEGGPCNDPDECVFGLWCFDGVCLPRLAEGSSCNDPGECDSGLSCFDGVCAPRLAEGSACEESSDCSTRWCDAGICTAPRILDESALFCVGW